MAFGGSLDTFNFADVLQTLAMNRQSGVLSVRCEKLFVALTFREGLLTRASREPDPLPFFRVLCARGIMDPHVAERVRTDHPRWSAEEWADHAVGMGCPAAGVKDALRFCAEETVYDIFMLEHATFEFAEQASVPSDAPAMQLATASLIMEAARRTDEWGRLRSVIPSLLMIPHIADGVVIEADSADAGHSKIVFALADGQHSIDRIIRESCLGWYTVTQVLAAGIRANAVLEASEEHLDRQAELASLQGRFGIAADIEARLIERNPAREKYHIDRIAALEAENRMPEAAEALRRLATLQKDTGYAESALATLLRVKPIDSLRDEDYVQLLELYNATGRKQEAVEIALRLGWQQLDAGHPDFAEQICHSFIISMPDHPELCLFRARLARDTGNTTEAIAVYMHLARLHELRGNIDGTITAYRSILLLDPTRTDLRKEIEALMTSNAHRMRTRRYTLLAFALGGLFLVCVALLLFCEVRARHHLRLMKEKTEARLAEIRLMTDREERAEALRTLDSAWSTFSPGWTITALQSQVDQEISSIRAMLQGVSSEMTEENARIQLSHRAAYEEAMRLFQSGTTSDDRVKAIACLETLAKQRPIDEWVNRAVELLTKDERDNSAAERIYAKYADQTLSSDTRRQAGLALLAQHPSSQYTLGLRLPVKVTIKPPVNASISLNPSEIPAKPEQCIVAVITPQEPTATVWIPVQGYVTLQVTAEGYDMKPWVGDHFKEESLVLAMERTIDNQIVLNEGVTAQPIVLHETLYVATTGGSLAAIQAATGKRLWTFRDEKAGYDFRTAPYLLEDTIYLLDHLGRIVRINQATGREIGTAGAPLPGLDSISSPPLYADLPFLGGWYCLVGDARGKVRCLSLKEGSTRWEYDTESKLPLDSRGVYMGRAIYFAAHDGSVHQLREDGKPLSMNATNGKLFSFEAAVVSPLFGSSDMVIAGLSNGELAAWRTAFPIKKAWSVTLRNGIMRAPLCVRDGVAYAGIECVPGEVLAFQTTSGTKVWHQQSLPGAVSGNLALSGHELLVPCGETLVSLSVANGDILWSRKLEGRSVVGVAATGTVIFAVTDIGTIAMFTKRSGS